MTGLTRRASTQVPWARVRATLPNCLSALSNRRRGWQGYFPADSDSRVRVRARAHEGHIHFHTLGPLSVPWRSILIVFSEWLAVWHGVLVATLSYPNRGLRYSGNHFFCFFNAGEFNQDAWGNSPRFRPGGLGSFPAQNICGRQRPGRSAVNLLFFKVDELTDAVDPVDYFEAPSRRYSQHLGA